MTDTRSTGHKIESFPVTIWAGTYVSEWLRRSWPHGYIQLAEVNMATVCYVTGYTAKKIGDSDTFNLMSRRPGIGHNWLNAFKSDLLITNTVTIEGREYPVPKRYLEWEPEYLQAVKQQRQLIASSQDEKTDIQLDSKNRNYASKLKNKGEKI